MAIAQQALSDRATNAATCTRHQNSAFDHGQSGQNVKEEAKLNSSKQLAAVPEQSTAMPVQPSVW